MSPGRGMPSTVSDGPIPREDDLFAVAPGDDESADEHVVARLDLQAGRKVEEHRGWRNRHDFVDDAAGAGGPDIRVAQDVKFAGVVRAKTLEKQSQLAFRFADAQLLNQRRC